MCQTHAKSWATFLNDSIIGDDSNQIVDILRVMKSTDDIERKIQIVLILLILLIGKPDELTRLWGLRKNNAS